jgi:hypothetical protein
VEDHAPAAKVFLGEWLARSTPIDYDPFAAEARGIGLIVVGPDAGAKARSEQKDQTKRLHRIHLLNAERSSSPAAG